MAENTGEEQANIPIIPPAEIAGDEHITGDEHVPEDANLPEDANVPGTTTTVTTPDKAIENMEVHHHAHHAGKKSWKGYAWEFLMLFIAVFCGFLAEYFLEHRIEREKGRQYVQSMIADIASDSTKISQSLESGRNQEAGLDSLSELFNNPPYTDHTIKRMYVLMLKYTMKVSNVAFTKRTVSQLKYSGGMRLISDKASADEIIKYCEGADDIELQGEYFENNALNAVIRQNNKIFYLKYIKGINRQNINSFITGAPVTLATNNIDIFVEYSNQLSFTTRVLENYNNKLERFKSGIAHTIGILKKENNVE